MLGIAGLVGSGRTELARLIYGADPKAGGEVLINGKKVDIKQPKDALDAGIAYLTEDRKQLGLFLDMSVQDNINFGVIDRDARGGGVLNLAQGGARAESSIADLRVRVASAAVGVGSLSGGNQQKVLLSRWLEIGPKVMILDEPTRGVDIGAKAEIYRIIDELAQKGIGVMVISSELPEIMGICDRMLVMREGHIEGEVGGPGGNRSPRRTSWRSLPASSSERSALQRAPIEDGRRKFHERDEDDGRRSTDSGRCRRQGRRPKAELHTIIQVVGMLPVLILICIGFEFATGSS